MRAFTIAVLMASALVAWAVPSPGPIQHSPWTTTTNDPSVTVSATQPVSITTADPYVSLQANRLIQFTNTINGRINALSFDPTIAAGGDVGAKLQAAINNLPPRKSLYLPAGEYYTSQTLLIANNILIEGDGVSQEYQFGIFGTNTPFYGTLNQTVLRPFSNAPTNFCLLQVTNTVSASPAVVLRNLVFYGADGVCSFPGSSTNVTGYGGTNKDFVCTFTATNSTAVDFSVGGQGLLVQDCVAIGWSGRGFRLGGGSRAINTYGSLCGPGGVTELLGSDIYVINPQYHHTVNGIVAGSLIALGDTTDTFANWCHVVGGRIEWCEDFGFYFKFGEQLVLTGTEFDRTGYANLATEHTFTRYNLIEAEFKRGGCFWRGIDPALIPLASRNQACSIFLKNAGESYVTGVNRPLNSQDNGTGLLCPPIGAVLDGSRDSHYLMSGTWNESTNVSLIITNDQNSLTISQPGRLTMFDVNGLRYLWDNGSNALVSLHAITAPSISVTDTNNPVALYLDSQSSTNEAVIRITRYGVTNWFDLGMGGDNHFHLKDILTGAGKLVLDYYNYTWTFVKSLVLDTPAANQNSTILFKNFGTNVWEFGKFSDQSLGIFDAGGSDFPLTLTSAFTFNRAGTFITDGSVLNLAPVTTNGASTLTFISSGVGSARGSLGFAASGTNITVTANNGSVALAPSNSQVLLGTNILSWGGAGGTNLLFNGGTVNVTY